MESELSVRDSQCLFRVGTCAEDSGCKVNATPNKNCLAPHPPSGRDLGCLFSSKPQEVDLDVHFGYSWHN